MPVSRPCLALVMVPLLIFAACSMPDAPSSPVEPDPAPESMQTIDPSDPAAYYACAQDCDSKFYAEQSLAIALYNDCINDGGGSEYCWNAYIQDITRAEINFENCMQKCDPDYENPSIPYDPDCDDDPDDDVDPGGIDIQVNPNPYDPCSWGPDVPIFLMGFSDGSSLVLPDGKKMLLGF